MELPVPVLQAFLLVDHIYQDRDSGKHILAGTFNSVWSAEFPATFNRPVEAFLSLTNCHGNSFTVQFKLLRLADNTVVMQSDPTNIQLPDEFTPLSTLEFKVNVPSIPIPSPGVYAFEALVNGHLAGAIRLTFQKQGGDDNEQ